MGDIKNSIDESMDWLLYSGIQNIGSDAGQYGGFNSWFDLDWKNYKYVYSEITGYGATVLSFLYKRTGKKIFLERAISAADWLIGNALHPSGGILTRYYLEADKEADKYSFDSGIIYAFDTGMALFGVASVYKLTKEKRFLDAAIKMGNFLMDKLQRGDGSFFAYYDNKKERMVSEFSKWSTQSGSFHTKLAMGLIALSEISFDEKYKKSAEAVCGASLNFQESDGRFVSCFDTGSTHLHPHLYSCEGLLFAGIKLNNPAYISAACKGVFWALENAWRSQQVNYIYIGGKFNDCERVDALSQLLRLSSYFLQNGLLDFSRGINIGSLADHLLDYQKISGDHRGGFYFGHQDDGKKINHINSWCTMFAVQALVYYRDLLENKKIDINYLV